MYTRCSHCEAVFRVTMKELTAAQGKLRCGECASVFNAMDSLSTKLPEIKDTVQQTTGNDTFDSIDQKSKDAFRSQHSKHSFSSNSKRSKPSSALLISGCLVGLLSVILLTQLWLTRDIWLGDSRQPDKVKLLSRKVFTHPSEVGALVITGAIQNTADQPQPYPYLEAKLLDANDQVIALRRFRPQEYLDDYHPDNKTLASKQQATIRLKIQDPPGNKAKQFKFSFL